MDWEPVIGLEIHVQLATKSKIFSGAPTAYGASPNTQACAVDLGLPGVLPVLNREVVRMAVMFGLGVDAEIARRSVFARKNYFYPDLPKGYQISQYELPIVGPGHVEIELEDGTVKTVGITRAHLEEDAGKSLHEDFHGMTGIDLNRAGTPLLEIVSEPDMRSAKEAEATREKRARLIKAEAEQEASQKLTSAATEIAHSPAALELRRMQMITEVGAENNTTTIVLLPSDFVTLAKSLSIEMSDRKKVEPE